MKYMLLIYHDEQEWASLSETERQQVYLEYRELIQQLQTKGQYLGGEQLHPATTGKTVSVRNGKQMITDGPFAETREQIGGYFLLDVTNEAEAANIAGQIPSARMGAIEIRAVA